MILRDLKGEITGSAKWSRKWRRRVVGERDSNLDLWLRAVSKNFCPSIHPFFLFPVQACEIAERKVRCSLCCMPIRRPPFCDLSTKKRSPLFRERRNGYKAEGLVGVCAFPRSLPLFFPKWENGRSQTFGSSRNGRWTGVIKLVDPNK